MALVLSKSSSSGSAETVDLSASLEHYWRLDEVGAVVRVDSVAIGSNDLTVQGKPLATVVAGQLGNAFDTNAGGAYLTGANVNLAGRAFTIAGWVQVLGLDHTAPGDSAPVLSSGDGGLGTGEYSFRWSMSAASSGWCFEWGRDLAKKIQISSTPYGPDWNFFCVRYDLTTMRLKVNTTDVAQVESVGPSYYYKPFWVGLIQSGSRNYAADLRVDELGVWGRSVSDAEVATLYSGWTP